MNVAAVGLGGALGSIARYGVNEAALRLAPATFPWATLTVNVVGSFAMGALAVVVLTRIGLSMPVKLFAMTGLLGGFTTFSAFSLDTVSLIERGEVATALLYAGASVVLAIGAFIAGQAVARTMM
ncbi:MAG: fluoride efflux transporter CrcB [Hyphomicrobiaceae bacterium]